MKNYKYVIGLLLFYNHLLAQVPENVTVNWSQITPPRGNFKFSFPNASTTQADTLGVLFYAYEVDSILSLQVQYIENVTTNIAQTDPIWQSALNQNNGDTLRAMGSIMVLLSDGTLESIQDLAPSGSKPKGIEIGLKYPSETSDFDLMVSRLYYQNNIFRIFTIGSIVSDATRLGTYKTSFFNSITFY